MLRSAFNFKAQDIARALLKLIHLPNVRCEERLVALSAVHALLAGMDFADALHLAASRHANEGFASFDARLVKRARRHWPDIAVHMA